MLTKEELPACPVATTVQLIGSKWKLLILRNLLARPWRFNELKKNLEGISQKVLTDSLRSLEEDGIVTRTVYPEVPPRVEYSLSELGDSMRPIISAMEQWGLGYQAKVQRDNPPQPARRAQAPQYASSGNQRLSRGCFSIFPGRDAAWQGFLRGDARCSSCSGVLRRRRPENGARDPPSPSQPRRLLPGKFPEGREMFEPSAHNFRRLFHDPMPAQPPCPYKGRRNFKKVSVTVPSRASIGPE